MIYGKKDFSTIQTEIGYKQKLFFRQLWYFKFIYQEKSPNGNDGPSQVLIDVIKNNNNKAPGNWKGFRELTSK